MCEEGNCSRVCKSPFLPIKILKTVIHEYLLFKSWDIMYANVGAVIPVLHIIYQTLPIFLFHGDVLHIFKSHKKKLQSGFELSINSI